MPAPRKHRRADEDRTMPPRGKTDTSVTREKPSQPASGKTQPESSEKKASLHGSSTDLQPQVSNIEFHSFPSIEKTGVAVEVAPQRQPEKPSAKEIEIRSELKKKASEVTNCKAELAEAQHRVDAEKAKALKAAKRYVRLIEPAIEAYRNGVATNNILRKQNKAAAITPPIDVDYDQYEKARSDWWAVDPLTDKDGNSFAVEKYMKYHEKLDGYTGLEKEALEKQLADIQNPVVIAPPAVKNKKAGSNDPTHPHTKHPKEPSAPVSGKNRHKEHGSSSSRRPTPLS
ncbi:hypothetical protein ACMFMG_004822 [Clarireedia jacksonii]